MSRILFRIFISQRFGGFVLEIVEGEDGTEVMGCRPRALHPSDGDRMTKTFLTKQLVKHIDRRSYCQDATGLTRGENLCHSCGGTSSINGHMDAIGLKDAQNGNDGSGRFGNGEADAIRSLAAHGLEQPGQPIGTLLQFQISDAPVVHNEGGCIRPTVRLLP